MTAIVPPASLQTAVDFALTDDVAISGVETVYRTLESEINQRRPICSASGRCCNFEAHGHRLYVTTLELAAFVRRLREAGGSAKAGWDGTGCPFQVNKLCGVHAIRPFGCRVYFCDPISTEWQHGAYERHHSSLKMLHEERGVPYFYVEWRAALREIGLSPERSCF